MGEGLRPSLVRVAKSQGKLRAGKGSKAPFSSANLPSRSIVFSGDKMKNPAKQKNKRF